MVLLLPWMGAPAAHAACDASALHGDLGRAEVAFAAMDATAFDDALAAARRQLDCLQEPLTAGTAAAWHRVEALDHFLSAERGDTVAHFQAARALEPGYELPTAIALGDHPLRDDWTAAPGRPMGPSIPLAAPAAGWLAVDGARATDAPDRPYLLQQFGVDGSSLRVVVVEAGEPAPEPLAVRPLPTLAALPPEPVSAVPSTRRHPIPFVALALATGAGAAVCQWQAHAQASAFYDHETRGEDIRAAARTANDLTIASIALGGAAAGATASAVWVRW